MTSICEIVLPIVLCSLVLLSKLARDEQVEMGNMTFAQDSYLAAAATLSPLGFIKAISGSEGVKPEAVKACILRA